MTTTSRRVSPPPSRFVPLTVCSARARAGRGALRWSAAGGEGHVWERIVGGVCGIGITVAVLVLPRQRGVSGEGAQQWETAIVIAAAAAGVTLWFVKRRQRRDQ